MFSSPGARERKALEKLVEKKISVSHQRYEELLELEKGAASGSASDGALNLTFVFLTPPLSESDAGGLKPIKRDPLSEKQSVLEEVNGNADALLDIHHVTAVEEAFVGLRDAIADDTRWSLHMIGMPQDDWKQFKTKIGAKAETKADALILALSGSVLSDMGKTVIAASMLQGLPVIFFALPECSQALADKAQSYTGNTWPVFWAASTCAQYVSDELVRILTLRNAVIADINDKIASFREVNVAKHFTKRAAVAFIPGGVMAVNFVGLVRLCGRMMTTTGMLEDKESKKLTAKLGSFTAGKVAIIDSLGDVYQYAIFATILADFASAASLEAAVSTLTLADGFLLGTVSVVTGAISAVGAYYTRPQLVDTIRDFLATVQLIYLLNLKMRRIQQGECASSKDQAL